MVAMWAGWQGLKVVLYRAKVGPGYEVADALWDVARCWYRDLRSLEVRSLKALTPTIESWSDGDWYYRFGEWRCSDTDAAHLYSRFAVVRVSERFTPVYVMVLLSKARGMPREVLVSMTDDVRLGSVSIRAIDHRTSLVFLAPESEKDEREVLRPNYRLILSVVIRR